MTAPAPAVDLSALDKRSEAAWRRLAVAIRLDVNRFVSDAVESRLRARPNLMASLRPLHLTSLRDRVDSEAAKAADALDRPVSDLRIYYGAEDRGVEAEDRAFATTVGEAAQEVAGRLLLEMAFPGDDKPDKAGETAMDLDAEYELAFAPSSSMMWAWRQVRELDLVRNRIADGAAPAFETRWHLPELGTGSGVATPRTH